MPRRRRTHGLERVLGTPALFATAYGNVGSSIYYALGVTAAFALGLTPLVFVVAGDHLRGDRRNLRRGDGPLPGGRAAPRASPGTASTSSSASARPGRRCSSTSPRSPSRRSSCPHYLSVFWEPLRENPWDIVGGAVVVVVLVAVNIVGVQEAARVNILLAVVDFATQALLVVVGFVLVFSPEVLKANIHWGVAPTWSDFAIAIPVAMLAYTGVETVSNLAEEVRDPPRNVPNAYKLIAAAVFAIYFTLPLIALSALPGLPAAGRRVGDAARAAARGGWVHERPDPRRGPEPRPLRRRSCTASRSTSASSRRRSSSSPRTPA